jgi:hypothetical protein
MKLINPPKRENPVLPSGKVSVRWVKGRNVYQVYTGRKYLCGASGDSSGEALDMMRKFYIC